MMHGGYSLLLPFARLRNSTVALSSDDLPQWSHNAQEFTPKCPSICYACTADSLQDPGAYMESLHGKHATADSDYCQTSSCS